MDIKKFLKLSGLVLAPDASAYLFSNFKPKTDEEIKRFVSNILANPGLEGNRVSKQICEKILSEFESESSSSETFMCLIDALDIPRFKYCQNTKKFVPFRPSLEEDVNSLLPSSPSIRSFVCANRYEVVFQHVTRNPLFASDGKGFKLRPVEFLLSMGAKETSVIVLGVLTQLKNAQWYLEDPSNLVKLDLSQTRFHQGVFSEGSVVLAEGWYDDEVFHATGIGLPPVERAVDTRRYFSVSNPFGGASLDAPAASNDQRMIRLLNSAQDSMIVLLGETRLDVHGCLDHLETVFMGYTEFPPAAFVLCGNFISPDYGTYPSDKRALLRQLFGRLTDAFLRAYGDAESRGSRQPTLVLVPGPSDLCLGPPGIYPRPSLAPDLFQAADRSKLPAWLHLASNPIRLRLFTREIVVFRYDYGQLLRHCVHLPSTTVTGPTGADIGSLDSQPESTPVDSQSQCEDSEANQSSAAKLGLGLARCLTSQAHLTPLPLHSSPVYWAYDQSLSLNPLPDLVVAVEPNAIADLNAASAPPSSDDKSPDPFGGCQFTNPGRFGTVSTAGAGTTEYTFKVYYPSSRVVEDSRLPS
ncbi:unnamed protein product [Mesocestoides corti]|uniref:DNA polymerase epsilon subunit n=3 Tax=Mesocestoides corti TaxID=53468 RepID=A0A0R3U2Z2_MESCO|nr:unnamed protein product [Mesocestoides corti]